MWDLAPLFETGRVLTLALLCLHFDLYTHRNFSDDLPPSNGDVDVLRKINFPAKVSSKISLLHYTSRRLYGYVLSIRCGSLSNFPLFSLFDYKTPAEGGTSY